LRGEIKNKGKSKRALERVLCVRVGSAGVRESFGIVRGKEEALAPKSKIYRRAARKEMRRGNATRKKEKNCLCKGVEGGGWCLIIFENHTIGIEKSQKKPSIWERKKSVKGRKKHISMG